MESQIRIEGNVFSNDKNLDLKEIVENFILNNNLSFKGSINKVNNGNYCFEITNGRSNIFILKIYSRESLKNHNRLIYDKKLQELINNLQNRNYKRLMNLSPEFVAFLMPYNSDLVNNIQELYSLGLSHK